MKAKLLVMAVGLLLVGTMAAQVNAATITLRFVGLLDQVTIQRSLDGGLNFSNAYPGQFYFVVINDPDDLTPVTDLFSFCIEPLETISGGDVVTYEVTALETAPVDGVPMMGANAANLLRELYYYYYPTNANIGALDSRALQIATWEIVTDWTSLNVSTGSTQYKPYDADGTAALTRAQEMLTAISGAGGNMRTDILAAVYDGKQDPWFPVPEPTALVLLGIGLAASGIINRRRG
jgi:hypothetical protein